MEEIASLSKFIGNVLIEVYPKEMTTGELKGVQKQQRVWLLQEIVDAEEVEEVFFFK